MGMNAMKAVEFRFSLVRYGVTLALGKVWPGAYTSALSCLHLTEIEEPSLPGPEWVKVKTRYAGICGSDIGVVRLHDSPMLSVYSSFPFVMGHENYGLVSEAGVESGFTPGDRVVVDPVLPCSVRGVDPPCPRCQALEPQQCEHFTDGALQPGVILGGCASTGGTWSSHFLAHKSQIFPVPDSVSDENAALVDPFASALHPVARHFPDDGDTVLIVGCGIIGLAAIAALRGLDSRATIVVLARYPFQAELARGYGADEVILSDREGTYVQHLAQRLGGRVARPIIGAPVMVGGGADIVFDCVGSRTSIEDALRFARSGGTMVLVGAASTPGGLDWTPIWFKELTLAGTMCYGYEYVGDRPIRTYQLALDLITSGRVDLSPLLTHTFGLEDWRLALHTVMNKSRNRVVKGAFVFD